MNSMANDTDPRAGGAPLIKGWAGHLPALTLFLALTLWLLYPLWLHPASRIEGAVDPLLNVWILAWDHYALFHQAGEFFQANLFWPHADSLAYGEHMLTQAVLLLPLRLLTQNAVLLYNLSLAQGYFFSALGAYLLALYYFRSRPAAMVAGLAYGFAAYRLVQSGHLQLVHGEFLPLMVLGFERVLGGGDRRWGWLLGLAALGQWLTSWYWAVFSFWCLAPYFAGRLWAQRAGLSPRRMLAVVGPLLLAGACVLPVARPYMRLKADHYLFRPQEAFANLSALPGDYLVPAERSLLYGWAWLGDPLTFSRSERALFPGLFLSLGLLAALGLALRGRRGPLPADETSAPAFPLGLWLGITLLLLLFTFGSEAVWAGPGGARRAVPLPYGLIRYCFPMADQMRVPARWMLPALLGLALLAAEVWRRLFARRRALALAFWGLLLAESLATPSPFVPLRAAVPPAFGWLNEQPNPSPVLILPAEHELVMQEAIWLRQPLANGYNGYFPPGQRTLLRRLDAAFPDPAALADLRGLGIRFVVLNTEQAARGNEGWTAGRVRQVQGRLATQGLAVRTLGAYAILDLGPPDLDVGRIQKVFKGLTALPAAATGAPAAP